MSVSVAVIGECMLELRQLPVKSAQNALPMDMGYGGDTLNTSVYMARNELAVSYVSALGDDPMSDWLIGEWQKEGVNCDLVERMANAVPGMYMIDVADDGERFFYYWRAGSPASRLFDDESAATTLFSALQGYDCIYLSGISLAILPADSRERLLAFLSVYRANGGKLIFDGNYRPKLWDSVEIAQSVYQQMYQMTDIALPTLEDEEMLFGYDSAEKIIDVIREQGVKEIVVKMGSAGCLAFFDDRTEFVPSIVTTPVDTTAAGDSFNAGYLSARLTGSNAVDSCLAGHGLASKVIQHQGAIIPSS